VSPALPPVVAVFVGTDHHRFDRLLGWVARLQGPDLHFEVQHGFTPLPVGLVGTPMMGPVEMAELLGRASAVVTHGGPGSIMDARDHGHIPVVVARDPRLGEHVDDHQQRFVRHLDGKGMVAAAHDASQFEERLRVAVLFERSQVKPPVPSATMARFERLIEDLVHR
jgi:UDP-N-acetylglucosamine transferase subunit ALG13